MKETITQLLDDLGVKYHWLDHVAVFTVKEASLLPEEHMPVKNLLVQEENNGKKFLIVMLGNERLDMKMLKHTLGAKKLRFASNETLLQTFGVSPGSVSIFGMLHPGSQDVTVLVDQELLNSSEDIGFHPNDNTATIFFEAKYLEPVLAKMNRDYKIMKLY